MQLSSLIFLLTSRFEVNNVDSHMTRKQIKKRHIEKECWKAEKDMQFGTMHLFEKGVKRHILKQRTGEMLANQK